MTTRVVPIGEIVYSLSIAHREGNMRRDINNCKAILRKEGQIVPLMVKPPKDETKQGKKYYLDRQAYHLADALVLAALELDWEDMLVGWVDLKPKTIEGDDLILPKCVECGTEIGTKECPTFVNVVEFRYVDGEGNDKINNEFGPYCTYRCMVEDINNNLA